MIETGKVLQQRYRIDKQIGQGGMGAVYVATDERFGSMVAIKETLCMDDNYRKAIEREARLLNSLKHTALLCVSDHFVEENGQFLVMEFISGEDLAHILETTNLPFPVEQVLTWADQLLDALDFLHNQVHPVIHRDIKPQNLKVTPKGQIILLDFGLAKGNPTDAGHHTAAKSIFGYSRNYASLEQIQGTGTDPRSDLYSLAATLYHLLTNTPPEDALTRAMAVLSHHPDPLVPANRIVSEVPAGVAAVLHSALALNAAQRPATAGEMQSMLRDHEQYADLVAAMPTSAHGFPTELHTQQTRLMPGSTFNDAGRQTGVKTEVLPRDLSHVTSLKAGAVPTTSRKSRKFITASLVAAVLLACSVVGGVYLLNPTLFDRHRETPAAAPQVVEPVPPAGSVATNMAVVANTATIETNTGATAAGIAGSGSATIREPEPSRPARSQGPSNRSVQVGTSGLVVDGDTVYMGNTRISNGRVEMPNRVFDANGINQRTPRMQIPPIPPPNLRDLTPEQRRRVLRALRRSGVTVAQPQPQPRSTP